MERVYPVTKEEAENNIDFIINKKEFGKVLFKLQRVDELNPKQIDYLNGFHMRKMFLLERDDDYFAGIRANHFCIEVGINEFGPGIFYLITANHKGCRAMTLLSDK